VSAAAWPQLRPGRGLLPSLARRLPTRNPRRGALPRLRRGCLLGRASRPISPALSSRRSEAHRRIDEEMVIAPDNFSIGDREAGSADLGVTRPTPRCLTQTQPWSSGFFFGGGTATNRVHRSHLLAPGMATSVCLRAAKSGITGSYPCTPPMSAALTWNYSGAAPLTAPGKYNLVAASAFS